MGNEMIRTRSFITYTHAHITLEINMLVFGDAMHTCACLCELETVLSALAFNWYMCRVEQDKTRTNTMPGWDSLGFFTSTNGLLPGCLCWVHWSSPLLESAREEGVGLDDVSNAWVGKEKRVREKSEKDREWEKYMKINIHIYTSMNIHRQRDTEKWSKRERENGREGRERRACTDRRADIHTRARVCLC